ncbi:MAG: DUF4139 domain-containing protein [Flavobacteriales bacterium]|jgi:uncharacterized protein (TIGR02231 family)|nr:DUF4139 domain-containing protein [Flavobacteriales bacterium]
MIHKLLFTIALLTSFNLLLAQETKTVDAKIDEVTVFLNGAEIKRKATVSVDKGTNELKFVDLSPYIQPNSIQVKANNKALTIVSVNHEINYLEKKNIAKSPKVQAINDSIENLEFKLQIRQSYERVYNEEKSLLLTNKKMGGANTGVDIEDLMDAADFYRERLANIETKLLDIKRNKKELNAAIARLKKQRSLYYNTVKNTGEITVNLTASQRASAKIELTFVVNRAGWVPFYDIRSNNLEEPVDLTYKGKVYQKTGNDWNNVKVRLSTGNPSNDNTQPQFSKWYLQYYTAYAKNNRYSGKRKKINAAYAPAPSYDKGQYLEEVEIEDDELDFEIASNSLANSTTVTESTVNTTFDIALPYTIKSDGKSNLIAIQEYELPVSYQYYTMPRKDHDAFLLSNIVGWGDYNLLAGDANIYFENTFVGESYLETAITNDTLSVSMGRDKSIIVTREKIKDFCKNSTLGGNKKSTRGYELTIRNNKSQAIEIEVIDQIPLSKIKEIEVELIENKKAEYDEKTGKLTWRLKIPANSTETVSFKFSVKYPKNQTINNL